MIRREREEPSRMGTCGHPRASAMDISVPGCTPRFCRDGRWEAALFSLRRARKGTETQGIHRGGSSGAQDPGADVSGRTKVSWDFLEKVQERTL